MPRINNNKFYDLSIKRFKQTPQGLHWQSKQTQELRFEAILTILQPEIKQLSLVDAGCGFGDFYCYLHQEDSLPASYIGIDIHPKMVKIAKKRTKKTIIEANILTATLPEADYYVCSGAMNVLERFETTLFISQMLRFAKQGVIFNLLKGEDSSSTYNKYLPSEIRKQFSDFTGELQIIEGYLEDDFTVLLKKALP